MLMVNDGDSPVGAAAMPEGDLGETEHGEDLASLVEQPQKVMRIGTMIKQLLEEVRAAPLDEASRNRLRDIHAASIRELEQGLAGRAGGDLETEPGGQPVREPAGELEGDPLSGQVGQDRVPEGPAPTGPPPD